MKLAASGGWPGGQQGRAAKQSLEASLFIVVFVASPIPRLVAVVQTYASGAPFHELHLYLARAQDTVSERLRR